MSQSDWGVVGVVVGVVLLMYAGVMVFVVRRAVARSPRGITKRLRRAGDRVEVKVPGTAAVWDPGRQPGPDNGRWGPGRAIYTMGDSGIVQLHFQPALATAEDSSGPIPDFPPRPRAVRLVLAGYAVAVAVGFAVGAVVGPGPLGERLLWGYAGLLAAMVAIWLLTLVLNVGRAVRDTARPRTPVSW